MASSLAVYHDAGKLRYLSDPPTIFFSLDFYLHKGIIPYRALLRVSYPWSLPNKVITGAIEAVPEKLTHLSSASGACNGVRPALGVNLWGESPLYENQGHPLIQGMLPEVRAEGKGVSVRMGPKEAGVRKCGASWK